MISNNLEKQRSEWKRKGWSIPEFRGSKQNWYQTVVELVRQIGDTPVTDQSAIPALNTEGSSYPWRSYALFLKGIGLVSNRSGLLSLSEIGLSFLKNPSKIALATLLHSKYRLFGEVLGYLASSSKTVEELDRELCRDYCLAWANLSNTRRRMDWLEVLDLIESVGNRKWGLTKDGKAALDTWELITPDVINAKPKDTDKIIIAPAPSEIDSLLQKLRDTPSLHGKRNTYNIWVPSPNRIENLRTIIQYSSERVSRADLFKFVGEEFNLQPSSIESMMPFLKADGLIEEVGRSIYVATTAAKAWVESGSDIDFIRILHSKKRFIGELIAFTEKEVTRNDIYEEAKRYGINTDKTRWIIGFLLEAGLLEETQYLHLKATPLGLKLLPELPLMAPSDTETEIKKTEEKSKNEISNSPTEVLFEKLNESATNPLAGAKSSGVAFEEAISDVFCFMGFDARRIGGAGNTDVIVRWKNDEGKTIVAIVDAKSKSSGTVTHSDISDVAIETHKEKNEAEYVAIVGPGFSGDTIKNHARKKGFALITVSELIDFAKQAQYLGLSLSELSTMFIVPNGLERLNELILFKDRRQELISLVVSTFKQEQDAMGSLSARDLFLLLRATVLSPSLEELIIVLSLLSKEEIGVLSQVKEAPAIENTTYEIHEERQSINRLRALACSIEKGLL